MFWSSSAGLSPTVQKKLPKIIASFANSAGGWLVIGIADDDKSICPVPRLGADYSQIIGELCRRHISPAPRIDVRFLTRPDTPDEGVIVVQVLEGDFPPYVADGAVDVREGSTSGPAASSALVELYGKATRRRLEVREFCRRTVFFAADNLPLFNLLRLSHGQAFRGAANTCGAQCARRRHARRLSPVSGPRLACACTMRTIRSSSACLRATTRARPTRPSSCSATSRSSCPSPSFWSKRNATTRPFATWESIPQCPVFPGLLAS